MTYTGPEKRKNKSASDAELYKTFKLNPKLKTERRQDELSRLREIQSQKKLWWRVIIACVILNAVFVGLGLWGMMS